MPRTASTEVTQVKSVHDVHAAEHSAPTPPGRDAQQETQPAPSSWAGSSSSSSSFPFPLPIVHTPPPLALPQEELDTDREMARRAAVQRGERRAWGRAEGHGKEDDEEEYGGWAGEEEDHGDDDNNEDVNGFLSSAAGAKARKRVSSHA